MEKCSFAKEEVNFLGHRIRDGKLMIDSKGYSGRAAPLTDLLKKNKAWEWDGRCQQAFEDLKKAVTEEPVLALPDHKEVHTDASDFAIGGVLMQERHPIAFESRKLNDAERLKTDNVATSYFQTQKKLSPKQARWQDFLAEFDYTLEYKPGSANHVADALRRPTLHKGRRLYVPKWGNIRRNLIKECHDTKWAGHPGQRRTRALLESAYYWPQIRDEVEAYVRTCLVCQQDKVEQRQPRGLLEPLPVAERPWDSVTMDFIIGLPKSEDRALS
ncbi:Transposon Ty3-I Gag-Pol polyprotein [Vitis vinifera]|uniref:Transposon Ty3-I Gag-Pol polyprotein n=1 Tax=Vitis vinifera TaxID=29760 RepID=A0A438DCB9_VITVI|nr:Transposon Ty3-I Gag-Pol polyprotein [Vitis vinifera]